MTSVARCSIDGLLSQVDGEDRFVPLKSIVFGSVEYNCISIGAKIGKSIPLSRYAGDAVSQARSLVGITPNEPALRNLPVQLRQTGVSSTAGMPYRVDLPLNYSSPASDDAAGMAAGVIAGAIIGVLVYKGLKSLVSNTYQGIIADLGA